MNRAILYALLATPDKKQSLSLMIFLLVVVEKVRNFFIDMSWGYFSLLVFTSALSLVTFLYELGAFGNV